MKLTRPPNFQAIELLAVLLTVMLKFILMDWLGMRAFYIAGTCLFWIGYVVYRYNHDHSVLRFWGFKREHFRNALLSLLPFLALAIAFALVYGKITGISLLNFHILPVLMLYPVWGIIQQFLLVCIIAQNLQKIAFFSSRKNLLIIIVSIFFSLIHYPYLTLMGFTLLMEIIFMIVFFRWRNLWVIGLLHGWIATFLLYFVLDRDLWIELFAWF